MDFFSFINESLLPEALELQELQSQETGWIESEVLEEADYLGSKPPWAYDPSSYLEDWDKDGIPNYDDNWVGPGRDHVLGVQEMDLDSSKEVIGNPMVEADYWSYQGTDNSCAVTSQKSILFSLTGHELAEEELTKLAEKEGWYDPAAGTVPADVGKILEAYGIPVTREYDNYIIDIASALEAGEKVIVGLDASEIWYPKLNQEGLPVEQPNQGHAVWVTGIHEDGQGNLHMVLNDPGLIDGAAKMVAVEDFLNAWDDFDNFAVVTDFKSGDGQIA